MTASTNRLDQAFARTSEKNRAAFIPYLCAGDPSADATLDLVLALEKVGADIIELGVPFSDPLADGIVNQRAAARALEAGMTTAGVLQLVARIREQSQIPIVLFTYLNPLYVYGFEKFHADAAAAGVDGILVLDLPLEEEHANRELAESHGLYHIHLIAPTTSPERIASIGAESKGFIYYVSREGVTGAQTSLSNSIDERLHQIRPYTTTPIAVGFGISTPEQAAQVAQVADGVVVGSAIVQRIADHGQSDELIVKVRDFTAPLAAAMAK